VWSKLLRVLSHPVLSAAGNVYTLVTVIPGAGSVVAAAAAPFTATQWLIISAMLAVLTVLIARSRFGHINLEFEAELTAIVEQGRSVDRGPMLGGIHLPSYNFWERKTSEFLGTTLGRAAQVAFDEKSSLKAQREWLVDLLNEPNRWKLRGDLREAAARRREMGTSEAILLVDGPLYQKDANG
jgi:hypothetical protein